VPGVLAVLTGRDAAAEGLASIPHKPVPTNPNEFPLGGREGGRVLVTSHPPLPADVARFAGEAVAVVVAETAAAAADGADRVRVSYEPLPSVTATPDAATPGAPVLWAELGSNLCVDSIAGDAGAADAAFAAAAHTVRLETWVPRITGVPLEPRAALGVHDATTGRYTLYAGTGGPVEEVPASVPEKWRPSAGRVPKGSDDGEEEGSAGTERAAARAAAPGGREGAP